MDLPLAESGQTSGWDSQHNLNGQHRHRWTELTLGHVKPHPRSRIPAPQQFKLTLEPFQVDIMTSIPSQVDTMTSQVDTGTRSSRLVPVL
eukprot:1233716-Rhodomonas_salina.1